MRGKNMGDILDVISTRRSIRRYKPDPVPDEMIDKILEAGRWAPTGENYQPWRLIVVRNPETLRRIGELGRAITGGWATADYSLGRMQSRFAGIQDPVERERVMKVMYSGQVSEFPGKAPLVIVVAGDLHPPCLDVAYDLCACIENILLEAHSLGLGGCWVHATAGHVRRSDLLKDLLKIPRGMGEYKVMAVLAIGWPSEQRKHPRPKKPLEDIVFWEEFGNKVRR
jgi:nitroreductase